MAATDFSPDLLADLQSRVLPMVHPEIRLVGLLAYGSRVSKQARVDSDWDLLALVEVSDQDHYYSEYHGYLQGDDGRLPLELRLCSASELRSIINKPDVIRISAIANGAIVADSRGELAMMKNESIAKFETILQNFRSECMQMKETEITGLLQTVMSEGRSIIASLIEKQSYLSAEALMFELLPDFLVYTEILRMHSEPVSSNEELANLYFLRRGRGARFLNTRRYQSSSRMEVLIRKLDDLFSNRNAKLFDAVFLEMELAFKKLTGLPLFLAHTQWSETVIRPEVRK